MNKFPQILPTFLSADQWSTVATGEGAGDSSPRTRSQSPQQLPTGDRRYVEKISVEHTPTFPCGDPAPLHPPPPHTHT
ncbi:hypothetical protein HOLleu_29959 [Holothuria leucospilota]|uniref:Uncharacterized protein n=1 Tax=Holothuria leucospilota TaxID=206669 RepID=A0A9Q1BJN6_HOLLE|nr:hypothetical protein HOLleu_29959 [Holothuria leucospilota]